MLPMSVGVIRRRCGAADSSTATVHRISHGATESRRVIEMTTAHADGHEAAVNATAATTTMMMVVSLFGRQVGVSRRTFFLGDSR